MNCHRKTKLTDANIQIEIKKQITDIMQTFTDIFSKHIMDIEKSSLVQINLKPNMDIKPLIKSPTSCNYDIMLG